MLMMHELILRGRRLRTRRGLPDRRVTVECGRRSRVERRIRSSRPLPGPTCRRRRPGSLRRDGDTPRQDVGSPYRCRPVCVRLRSTLRTTGTGPRLPQLFHDRSLEKSDGPRTPDHPPYRCGCSRSRSRHTCRQGPGRPLVVEVTSSRPYRPSPSRSGPSAGVRGVRGWIFSSRVRRRGPR